jgi:hypothetical protein
MEKRKMAEQKETKVTRNKRIPFNVPRTKLSVDVEIEGYHLRWVNDVPGRIHQAEQAGYQFVEPKEIGSTDEGTRVSVLGGVQKNGSPLIQYLMKIPMEWYLEDKKLASDHLDEIDRAIRGGKTDGAHANRYVPEGGISIKR